MGGHLYYMREGNSDLGLYRVDPLTGKSVDVNLATGTIVGRCGLTEVDHPAKLLFGGPVPGLMEISIDRGRTSSRGGVSAEGLGYDPLSKTLYGSLSTGEFFTIDTSTGERIRNLADPPNPVLGLAVLDGVVYGLGNGDRLYSYDPSRDFWTVVGGTGYFFVSPGLAADPERKILYAIGVAESSMLYQIEPATAATKVIGDAGTAWNGGGLAYIAFSQPDLSVSVPRGKSVGVGVFTPIKQAKRVRPKRSRSRITAHFKITSVDRGDEFVVGARYSHRRNTLSRYRTEDGKNRTVSIAHGFWRTPVLAAGESTVVYATFQWGASGLRQRRHEVQLKATSRSDRSLTDSAGLTIVRPITAPSPSSPSAEADSPRFPRPR